MFHEPRGHFLFGSLLQPAVHDPDLRSLPALPGPLEVEPPRDLLRDRVAVLLGGRELDASRVQRVHGRACIQERPEQLAVLHTPTQHDEQLHTHIHVHTTGTRCVCGAVPVCIR